MTQRQSKEWARLRSFRLLEPGEIESEIAVEQLVSAPVLPWNAPTVATCLHLYHRYIEPAMGARIPDTAFCDLPRWVFLEFLTRQCGILLVGSGNPEMTHLEPQILSQNVNGWNTPRLFAFSDSIFALFQAVLDHQRLRELDCPLKTTVVLRDRDSNGCDTLRYYFGLDYRALPYAPWRRGTVYLYACADFPFDFERVPYTACPDGTPIRPLAKLDVSPWDWPLLDQVHGFNVVAQSERQHETFAGYPWPVDDEIHPHRFRQSLIEQARAYLDTHYAENIGLTDLGMRAGVSTFALLRMFRASVGLSPHEYQTLRRITVAKQLLSGGFPIAQTAVETGFYDQTHLTRHFRQIVGVTPGQYIRMQESPIGLS